MKKLNNNELKNINGGFSIGLAIAIPAVISLIAGVLSGIANPDSCNKQNMKKCNNTKTIIGGSSVSGPIINGIVNLLNAVYKIGRGMGGAIRRIGSGNVCPV